MNNAAINAGMGVVVQKSGSVGNRIQDGSNADAGCLQVFHLLASCWGLQQSSGVPPELGAGTRCLTGAQMGGEGQGCALGLRA